MLPINVRSVMANVTIVSLTKLLLRSQQTQDTYKYEVPWKDQYETEKYKTIAPRSDVPVPDYGAMAKKHKSTEQKESITRSNLRRMVMEELKNLK